VVDRGCEIPPLEIWLAVWWCGGVRVVKVCSIGELLSVPAYDASDGAAGLAALILSLMATMFSC